MSVTTSLHGGYFIFKESIGTFLHCRIGSIFYPGFLTCNELRKNETSRSVLLAMFLYS